MPTRTHCCSPRYLKGPSLKGSNSLDTRRLDSKLLISSHKVVFR